MARKATTTTAPLHVRLMDGLNVHSRPNGTVHTIKDTNGKAAAEICVGGIAGKPGGTVRLNFRAPFDLAKASATVKSGAAMLQGRSSTWLGQGVVCTDANEPQCRAMLLHVCGTPTPAPKARVPRTPKASDVAADQAASKATADAERERIAAIAESRETANA